MNETTKQSKRTTKICLKCGRGLRSNQTKCSSCGCEDIMDKKEYHKLIDKYERLNTKQKIQIRKNPNFEKFFKYHYTQINDTQINGFTIKQKITGCILIILFIFMALYGLPNSENSRGHKSTVRCSYCGKVIRSNGRNIHGTPVYNGGVLECEYCGHKTSIKD